MRECELCNCQVQKQEDRLTLEEFQGEIMEIETDIV